MTGGYGHNYVTRWVDAHRRHQQCHRHMPIIILYNFTIEKGIFKPPSKYSKEQSGSPTHLLLEVGWGFNAPKSGNFFFEAFQHSHLAMLKAEWGLIEFVRISSRSDTNFEFPHFTQCCCSRAFMSPSQSSLRHPPNPHFVFSCFSTCISHFHLHDISKGIFFSCADEQFIIY